MPESHNFKKKFGQNFLRNFRHTVEIVELAQLNASDLVIEIGPGAGALTDLILQSGCQLMAIEVDEELIPTLQERFAGFKNFQLVQGDILELDIDKLVHGRNYKVIGALPYNISKKIIAKFLTSAHPPELALFVTQAEVARKYTAQKPKNSFLANFARLYADPKYHGKIGKNEFYPRPKVDGGIISFTNFTGHNEDTLELRRFIKLGFSQARKKLSSNLANYGYSKIQLEQILTQLQLSASARAAELDLQDWRNLWRALHDK